MQKNSFSKDKIVAEKSSFRAAMSSDLRLKAGFLRIFACKNALGYSRLGMCISKKHVPKATQRNKIKRKIRESFRTFGAHLGLEHDIIFQVAGNPKTGVDSLEGAWRKLQAVCAN